MAGDIFFRTESDDKRSHGMIQGVYLPNWTKPLLASGCSRTQGESDIIRLIETVLHERLDVNGSIKIGRSSALSKNECVRKHVFRMEFTLEEAGGDTPQVLPRSFDAAATSGSCMSDVNPGKLVEGDRCGGLHRGHQSPYTDVGLGVDQVMRQKAERTKIPMPGQLDPDPRTPHPIAEHVSLSTHPSTIGARAERERALLLMCGDLRLSAWANSHKCQITASKYVGVLRSMGDGRARPFPVTHIPGIGRRCALIGASRSPVFQANWEMHGDGGRVLSKSFREGCKWIGRRISEGPEAAGRVMMVKVEEQAWG
ncbi:hypothetical protein FPV67DRAFT_1449050 [Lyophyllum atratum]|nr:hypothetical protein FPV67DRAFT_1449050 [Lyophyllum atratum]